MNSFANIKTIAKRELVGYFASPVAYVFIVIFLLLTGFFTFMLGGFLPCLNPNSLTEYHSKTRTSIGRMLRRSSISFWQR